jgi:hypothetical protein
MRTLLLSRPFAFCSHDKSKKESDLLNKLLFCYPAILQFSSTPDFYLAVPPAAACDYAMRCGLANE